MAMKRAKVVVGVEYPTESLTGASDMAAQSISDLYKKADALARPAGGHVDPTVQPLIRGPLLAQSTTTGADVMAVAAEVTVLVPDGFDVERAAMESAPRWIDWV